MSESTNGKRAAKCANAIGLSHSIQQLNYKKTSDYLGDKSSHNPYTPVLLMI